MAFTVFRILERVQRSRGTNVLAYFTTNYYQKKPELSWAILPEDGYDFKDWLNGLKRNISCYPAITEILIPNSNSIWNPRATGLSV